ncbi:hypothetical protein NE237_010849 [Protea cynaroides]|uniref:Uncharacterized protein n=1 Tax=Protea cynaroides TaxID=273540 RepID=A0A9Q0R1Z1_9MAGN|nr:hypothetical protein NE237_010849 [Protea cynaroides]
MSAPVIQTVSSQDLPCTSIPPPHEGPSSRAPNSSVGVDPLSLPSNSSIPPGPSSTPAGLPPFAPSWRVHAADSDAQTLRAIPLEAIDRDQSTAIYQLICRSNHYHRMLSTALERLRGVQAVAQESERLMVATQTECDAAITTKTEMEGQLKVADEKLLEAEERFLKAEELAHEVQLMQKVIWDKLAGSSNLALPVTSSSVPAPTKVASSSLPAPPEVSSSSLPAPPKVLSSSAPALSNIPDVPSKDVLPSEG